MKGADERGKVMRRRRNWLAAMGAAVTGTLGGAEVGASVLPLLILDPTGTTAAIVLAGFAVTGAVGGAATAIAITNRSDEYDD